MRRLLTLALAAAATPDEGYLFVTNRGDEAVASARSLRRVAPHANITFVSDAATLRDVGPSLQVFDVVIRAEKAFPDLDVHDSQGFRLQKLRGGLASPYERTIFLDSDTRACKDPGATLFPLLRTTDVACVSGGRGNHSGASAGVLAFAKNARPNALWRHWEAVYRTVMQRTRREQPSFQVAVRKAKGEASEGGETADDLQLSQRAPLSSSATEGRHLCPGRVHGHPRPRLRERFAGPR